MEFVKSEDIYKEIVEYMKMSSGTKKTSELVKLLMLLD